MSGNPAGDAVTISGKKEPEPLEYLTRKEAAYFLTQKGYPISVRVLEKLAGRGGPPFVQWRWRSVRYQVRELLEWAKRQAKRVDEPKTDTP